MVEGYIQNPNQTPSLGNVVKETAEDQEIKKFTCIVNYDLYCKYYM